MSYDISPSLPDLVHSVWLTLLSRSILLLLLSRFSRVQLCNPMDGSPLGSPVPGILQARTLEWVAISFSNAWKWKVKAKSLSRVRLLATPWPAPYQAPPSRGFSWQEYWSGVPLLSATEWEEIFANNIFDQELTSKIYKELTQLSIFF